ncbi:hypothetical protein LOAG_05311 [Loa loa]|uniref:Uncharacterized protein n=1 Tax=Loa loa TaxID=7209 RepID=A0A1S0U1X0_LOALO|nr:hypothetical protein LOAG_05311 [Loa loa]EFO23172.2 hypothetical protein LOAG_05311 [Loa loa]
MAFIFKYSNEGIEIDVARPLNQPSSAVEESILAHQFYLSLSIISHCDKLDWITYYNISVVRFKQITVTPETDIYLEENEPFLIVFSYATTQSVWEFGQSAKVNYKPVFFAAKKETVLMSTATELSYLGRRHTAQPVMSEKESAGSSNVGDGMPCHAGMSPPHIHIAAVRSTLSRNPVLVLTGSPPNMSPSLFHLHCHLLLRLFTLLQYFCT